MSNKVSFIIQLKDKFGRTAAKVKRSTDEMRKSTDKLNKSQSKLGKTFSGINGRALDAAKGIGAMGAAMKTISVGAGFQDAIAELSAITGAKGGKLDTFTKDIMKLSKVSGVAQNEVAGAFTQIASAKSELLEDPKSLALVTKQTLLLAKASGISIPDAVRASVGSLNQFSAGADQAGRFVNVLAAGSKVGASQVGETAEALKNAGTIASQLGLSFESTNAILQVFAKNEVKGAEAGTALRGTLIQLEKMGGKFAPSVVGIDKSLENLAATTMSNEELIKKFGNENLRTALILRKNVPLINKWTGDLTGSSVASDQATTRLDTFNQKMIKAGTSLASIGIKIFNGFEPALSGVLDLFTFLLNAIEGVTSAIGEMIGQLAGIATTFSFEGFDASRIASAFGAAFGLEDINFGSLGANEAAIEAMLAPTPLAPTAPSQAANGIINGQITVAAERGSEVRGTRLDTRGYNLNVGMNMAGAQ